MSTTTTHRRDRRPARATADRPARPAVRRDADHGAARRRAGARPVRRRRSRCSPSRRWCSRSAPSLGIQRTPYAWLFRTLVRPRLGPPAPSSRTPRRRGSPRPSGSAFAVRGAGRLPAGADLLGAVATGFALAAAFLNAAFGFCLGCEVYLLLQRAAPARSHRLTHSTHLDNRPDRPGNERNTMSRDTALVNADWVEEHLDDPSIVLVEVDEDTTAYDKGHIRGAIKLDWTTDLQDQVRRDFVSKAQFEALLSEQGRRQRPDRRAVRRQQQLVRRLRLLVLQALRPPGRQAPRRRPQEVGARQPRADRRHRHPREDQLHRAGAGHLDPRLPRRDRRRDRRARTWSTYAAPTSTPAGCSPRPTCRRSRRSAPVTCPTSLNVPWSKNANDDGTFKSDEELDSALRRRRHRRRQGHHRAMPHRRALLAAPGSCCTELLGHQNVKNYDGSWTEYGSLVGVPIALGDEPGCRGGPDVRRDHRAASRSTASTSPRSR